VHFSRVQRDVLTHRSTRAVLIRKAEVIAFVTRIFFAPAIALDLLQNFRYVLGNLIGFSRDSGKHGRRQRLNQDRGTYAGFLCCRAFIGSKGKPRDSTEYNDRPHDEPPGISGFGFNLGLVFLVFLFQ
jgi:hypothetical protein